MNFYYFKNPAGFSNTGFVRAADSENTHVQRWLMSEGYRRISRRDAEWRARRDYVDIASAREWLHGPTPAWDLMQALVIATAHEIRLLTGSEQESQYILDGTLD